MRSDTATPPGRGAALLIVASCCLAAVGEGVDLQAPGVTLPVLGPLFGLSTGEGQGYLAGFVSQKSLFLSMSTFGLMLGALIGGRLSDLLGRKWVAVISVLLFALGSAVTAHATSAQGLLWCRFITGLGLGGAMPNLIAIVAESVPAARRSTAIGCLYGSLPFGGAIVSLASYSFANPQQWPYIYYLGALVPLLALPGLVMLVPSSRPGRSQPAAAPARGGGLAEALFGEGRALRTAALWGAFFLALITMYVLLSWLPSLLVAKGLPRPQASIVQVGFNVFGALGSVLTGILIDRAGRTGKIGLVFLSAILALGVLAAAPPTLALAFLAGSLVGFTVSGAQTILYALAPSCYPARVRGTGVGAAVSVGRFGSAVGPLLAGALLGGGASPARVLALLVPLLLLSGLLSVFLSPRATESDAAAAAH